MTMICGRVVSILGAIVVKTSGGAVKMISLINRLPAAGSLANWLTLITLLGTSKCLGFFFPVWEIR